ncbi:class I SAM-dependent methyltransferase [Streptomyces sp. NBC_01239]|uniref:methyltransferase domain-containing protein n=1 Tax=Streptomyces sp. NBC_01239 TaxID=2903792 RepID=UPI00224EF7E6|nr:methyltransferase domain-containing protein [Streptomyces sp. NBC_01239]MCX4810510.1 class I SAM-dependent methyltransferase [Streptomyces sp. NBC_01239]
MNSLRTRVSTRVSTLDAYRRHRALARAILRLLPEPESWLDVGTGDAHFPETAKALFPYTSFDGTDPTPRVVRARAAERIEEAYAGHLTDPHLTTALRARYDVVTLLRDRSPAPDPAAELHAALTVLRPGGLLLLEGPPDTLRPQLEPHAVEFVTEPRRLPDNFPLPQRLIARRSRQP